MAAMWTLGQVMSSATAFLGNRADLPVSTCSLFANQAALDINFAVEPQDVEGFAVSSTTSGENKITLPTDFYSVINVSNQSMSPPYNLRKINSSDIDSQMTTVSQPMNYVLYDSWMELWPSPDSSYSIQMRYQARPSVMTSLTALPSFDTRFGVAWMYRTTAYLARSVKDYETATAMDAQYLQVMATIPTDLALRQRDRNGQNVRLALHHREKVINFDDSLGPGSTLYGP